MLIDKKQTLKRRNTENKKRENIPKGNEYVGELFQDEKVSPTVNKKMEGPKILKSAESSALDKTEKK